MACPTPHKKQFKSKAKAVQHTRRYYVPAFFEHEKQRLYPYQCGCGWWHLSHLRQDVDDHGERTRVRFPSTGQ